MHIKPPDDNILQSSFPLVWWESEDVSIAEEGGGGGGGRGENLIVVLTWSKLSI